MKFFINGFFSKYDQIRIFQYKANLSEFDKGILSKVKVILIHEEKNEK